MDSISRLSGVLEAARDLTIEAARDASARRKPSALARVAPAAQIKKLLDSRSERDVLDGLRTVITMTYRGQACLQFFTAVIKNVASPSLEIKKLVYIYLLHHAEAAPDTALLSINTIQKSLSDSNAQLRELALRVMSGIRVPIISQIVALAIKKGVTDMSPLVRKAAALAIPKCYRLDPATLPLLSEQLDLLLGDRQHHVVGAAIAALLEVCPDRLDLIHRHYRSIVRKLIDIDEWGQLAALRLLTDYSRKCFVQPKNAAYDGDLARSGKEKILSNLDPDHRAFLDCIKPLLMSRNSAVIVAVTQCYFYCGTVPDLEAAIGPVMSLLRGPPDVEMVTMTCITQICLIYPHLFLPYVSRFLVRQRDSDPTAELKFEILTLLFPCANVQSKSLIVNELEQFCGSFDDEKVRHSLRAIGRCAQVDPKTRHRCVKLLLDKIQYGDGPIVSEALVVVRQIVLKEPKSHYGTILRLAKDLDTIKHASGRACTIWLISEFASDPPVDSIAADALRILTKGFADEPEVVKLQIILLSAKLYLHHLLSLKSTQSEANGSTEVTESTKSPPVLEANTTDAPVDSEDPNQQPDADAQNPVVILWRHVQLLARYDTSYDLRDRLRLYRVLLASPTETDLARLLLQAPKPVPHIPILSAHSRGYKLGSASLLTGDTARVGEIRGYEGLPPWAGEGDRPHPSVREEGSKRETDESGRDVSARKDTSTRHPDKADYAPTKAHHRSLDDWLAEGDEDKRQKDKSDDDQLEGSESEEHSDEYTTDESDEATSTDEGETEDEDEQHSLIRK